MTNSFWGKFRYLEEDNIRLPALVLAVRAEPSRTYKFVDNQQFRPIAHQTAGVACHQHYMYGRLLHPKPSVAEALKIIEQHWLGSNCGVFGVSLDDLIIYRAQLKLLLDEDCNYSYEDFEEGLYPMDLAVHTLANLCEDGLPESLDDLIQFGDEWDRFGGSIHRWKLYILSANSD